MTPLLICNPSLDELIQICVLLQVQFSSQDSLNSLSSAKSQLLNFRLIQWWFHFSTLQCLKYKTVCKFLAQNYLMASPHTCNKLQGSCLVLNCPTRSGPRHHDGFVPWLSALCSHTGSNTGFLTIILREQAKQVPIPGHLLLVFIQSRTSKLFSRFIQLLI